MLDDEALRSSEVLLTLLITLPAARTHFLIKTWSVPGVRGYELDASPCPRSDTSAFFARKNEIVSDDS